MTEPVPMEGTAQTADLRPHLPMGRLTSRAPEDWSGTTEARDLLRRETRRDHERVERHSLVTRMMGHPPDLIALRQVVAAHLALYRSMEPRIHREMPDCLRRHDGFRFREPLAAADFADLDGDAALIPSCPVPTFVGDAAWAGYLYVVEGSSLGGRLISARLERRFGRRFGLPLRTFLPYGRGTAAVWRQFVAVLERQLASDASRIAAVAAARTTFRLHDLFLTRAQDAAHEP